jgi:hypothetical protein
MKALTPARAHARNRDRLVSLGTPARLGAGTQINVTKENHEN